jgi:hypothetical protein
MSANVTKSIRDAIKEQLWEKADDLGWSNLTDQQRAAWYENWAKDKKIGGILAHFMDPRKVRVYIKDSLLKPYRSSQMEQELDRVLLALELKVDSLQLKKIYEKPHGRGLADGGVICWGNSRDWKIVLLSAYERSWKTSADRVSSVALIESGHTTDTHLRQMITDVSTRLGISALVWID